ncbi:GDSL-type esterase/lipase family protein [Streptomyces sp. NPDC001941]|uniref:GDSL-type esterase/lipase family protein n=1 Tax=Streptomyces sp. NPDC001941 TaxID=3154659 RepID=UPI0033296E07
MRTVFIGGNSTAAHRKKATRTLSGWGTQLPELLAGKLPDGQPPRVRNLAKDANSVHVFLRNQLPGLLQESRPGDLVLLAFGANERDYDRPDLALTDAEFTAYHEIVLDHLRAAGCVPVLLTGSVRHTFDRHGRLLPGFRTGHASALLRTLAQRHGVALVDVERASGELLARCTPDQARGYYRWMDPGDQKEAPAGVVDSVHFNEQGARLIAHCVARGLRDLHLLEPSVFRIPSAPPAPMKLSRSTSWYQRRWPHVARLPERLDAPVVTGPDPERDAYPFPCLEGQAPPDARWIVFREGDRVIGGTRVSPDGTWRWRRTVSWGTGPQEVVLTAIGRWARSAPVAHRFRTAEAVAPPIVTAPAPGSLCGPRPVFEGTADRGVTAVVAVCDGRWLGRVPVEADGGWRCRLPHDWTTGPHTVEFIAVRNRQPASDVRVDFTVVGKPAGHWLDRPSPDWEPCGSGGECAHIPRVRPQGIDPGRE